MMKHGLLQLPRGYRIHDLALCVYWDSCTWGDLVCYVKYLSLEWWLGILPETHTSAINEGQLWRHKGQRLLVTEDVTFLCVSRYCRKKALLQEKYPSNTHAKQSKSVGFSRSPPQWGTRLKNGWVSAFWLQWQLLIIWCVCFPFFFILIVDIPEIHGGEGYEDEIDGGYHYDLIDNHEIQLLLKTSTKNVLAIGRPAFRTISQKYKWKEPRGEQRNR